MAHKKPALAAAEAIKGLQHFARHRPANRDDWRALDELLLRLPEGLPTKKVVPALAHHSYPLSALAPLPAHLDEAIVLLLEKNARDPHAAFVRAGLSAGGMERLHELLALTSSLPWAARAQGATLRKLVKGRPWIVAGAQAAFAVTRFDHSLVVSPYLPVLAAEASAESLDVLLPWVRRIVKERSSDLDWARKEVVPLLPDTPPARALRELLQQTADERETQSPAFAFAQALGMNPPPKTLAFKLVFQLERPGIRRDWLLRHPFRVEVDSKAANWFRYQASGSGVFSTLKQPLTELPSVLGIAKSYTLRISSPGADKVALHDWATSLLAKSKKR